MKQILFVDDEPHILQGLKRMLRSFRREWQMHFANSGYEALELLSNHEIDVIVSDMRMPGMDGAELLENVKNSHPNVVRIILSGQSDKEMILKSVKPAHQFLSKPCNPNELKHTIQKALDLRDLLKNENVTDLISQIETLPSLPTLYIEIIDKLNEQDSSLTDVAQIIKKDVSMTAEILKLINSSFFGFSNKISNIEQSVSLLGMNMIRTLVLSVKVFSQFPSQDQISISLDELWQHSFLVGLFTGEIVYDFTKDKELQESAFTIGLLHDIGMIILASQVPQKYKKAYDHSFINQLSISEGEYHFLGSSHAEVGAYLVGLWGFSDQVTEAVAYHHLQNTHDDEINILTLATHVADVYAQKLHNKNQGLPLEEINKSVLLDKRYKDNHEQWLSLCTTIYNRGNDE
ncbi:MAG: HDOD domain-containing protein [Calditrichaeota bacterium]|nr:HDOD domain-containing protein [Calditrichota bacterium]